MLGVNKYTGDAEVGEFYNSAVKAFHDFAKGKGFAEKGILYVPDLAKYAREFTMDQLNDGESMNLFGSDEEGYYSFLTANQLRAGIAFGHQWHSDFTRVEHGDFLEKLDELGAAEYTDPLIEEKLCTLAEMSEFQGELFDRWKELVAGLWGSSDIRDKIFDSMMALFQLGISVILSAEGFTSAVREW